MTFRAQIIPFITLSLCLLLPASVSAQSNDWWFEIEVILFKRKVDPEQLIETFRQDRSSLNIKGAVDLITPYIQPDIRAYRDALPYCPGEFPPEIIRPKPLLQATYPAIKLDESSADDVLSAEPVPVAHNAEVGGEFEPVGEFTSTESNAPADSIQSESLFRVKHNFLLSRDPAEETHLPAWQTPTMMACVYPQEQQLLINPLLEQWVQAEFIPAVPGHINGVERPYANSSYLLASDSLQLNYLYKAIKKQRDLTPLLHMGWRQEVKIGRGKADNFRLFAGHNYAAEYSASGERLHDNNSLEPQKNSLEPQKNSLELEQQDNAYTIPTAEQDEQDKLYAAIAAALQDDSPLTFELNEPTAAIAHRKEQNKLEQLWELDGLFKVYLQYINKVPYLHIDSNLDYRAPVHVSKQTTEPQHPLAQDEFHLQSYRLNQLRRVISKEVHYFDHPLFGVIVQIRRHQRPEPLEIGQAPVEQSQ